MKKIINTLENAYLRILNSIAFYPTVVAVSGLVLFYVATLLEYSDASNHIKENFSYLFITNREEARLVLGTLVGSIISLMVFSFSMVMVVLNRASANLTPRVLPGLISNRSHQFVLGYYIGTIMYCLLIIVNFQDDGEFHIPSMGILVAMASGIMCLCLFIYFIHSIASSIQVSFILQQVYSRSRHCMEHGLEKIDEYEGEIDLDEQWTALECPCSGYLNNVDKEPLAKYLKTKGLKLKVNKPVGEFIYDKCSLIEINAEKIDDTTLEDIWSYFHIVKVDMLDEHYTLGFKHITEIAVKSLSPGINDPGTAEKSLDYLTLLYQQRFGLVENPFIKDDKGEVRLIISPTDVKALFYSTFIPIREYGKRDVMVLLKVLVAMENILLSVGSSSEYRQLVKEFIESLKVSADENIVNPLDKSLFDEKLSSLQL